MKEVSVQLPLQTSRGYTIYVGTGLIGKLGSLLALDSYSKILIVTDEAVPSSLLQDLSASLPQAATVTLPAGEQHKNISSVEQVWTALQTAGADRKSLVVNLGGGVISDLGGFAAATYMRGIDFVNLPTTLLSQVDASVGGKTGFNFGGIKNLVGSFAQPKAVIIDVETLASLPDEEFTAGFGEIIKHGIIRDKSYFDQVTAKKPRQFSQEELVDIIAGSCRIKAEIIEADEREAGLRKLVNFGHTVGHGLEAASLESGKPLLHGQAVSIGMVAEAEIARASSLLAANELELIREKLKGSGLPLSVKGLSLEAVMEKMRGDKKNENGQLNFTLPVSIGRARTDQHPAEKAVITALKTVLD